MRSIIAYLKITAFFSISVLTLLIQTIVYVLFKNTCFVNFFPNIYGKLVCLTLCIKVKVEGAPEKKGNIIFVGNHLSYADIGAIGGNLMASFISKAEVKDWPIFGFLATVARTVFIERDRNAALKCIADINQTLTSGQNLILFPEGTSSDGTKVLPFKSTLFELFLSDELKPKLTVQPFTVTITHTNGKPVEKPEDNNVYAWHGDDEFFPHLKKLAKSKGAKITLTFHPPRKAADYDDRKKFAHDCYQDVATGLKNTLPSTLDFPSKAA